jgi:hypothetical protein
VGIRPGRSTGSLNIGGRDRYLYDIDLLARHVHRICALTRSEAARMTGRISGTSASLRVFLRCLIEVVRQRSSKKALAIPFRELYLRALVLEGFIEQSFRSQFKTLF